MIDWPTFLAGLVASLIAALVTFVLGVKSGKNQTDRQRLQEMYRSLLVHFQDLKERLDSYPRRWEQYEEHHVGWETHYLPPVKKMEHEGNSVYIKARLFNEALELERDVLKFGYDVERYYDSLFDAIASNESLFKAPIDTSNDGRGRKCRRLKANDGQNYTTGISSRLFYFLQPGIGKRIEDALGSGGYLTFHDDRNPYEHELTINPGSYDDLPTFAQQIESLSRESGLHDELNSQRTSLKTRIDALIKKLSRRAKEPVPFWETFAGAFVDVFRP
ncbi:hypothetical protein [Enorma phocaeensis]|uniref:Uncharacterized protein n=1 Tax=Enorma phocaeensis TaxID=1871019 RepID=A0ABT7VAW2_9ACTN|nr:hypothetical protein [Enorma phocaeensis]MDM8275643.1 hypothetical protein [Enorma phocaeensis]